MKRQLWSVMNSFYSRLNRLDRTRHRKDISTSEFRAGVAILVRPDDHICMIRRAVKERDYWSGHMGFPGGRFEEGDEDLLQTAFRETHEEIGVRLVEGQYRGRLSDIHHPKMQIAAFVFDAPDPLTFILEESEVAEVHWLPLPAFQDPAHRGTREATYKGQPYQAPVVNIGTADVWGISLTFIENLLHRLEA